MTPTIDNHILPNFVGLESRKGVRTTFPTTPSTIKKIGKKNKNLKTSLNNFTSHNDISTL